MERLSNFLRQKVSVQLTKRETAEDTEKAQKTLRIIQNSKVKIQKCRKTFKSLSQKITAQLCEALCLSLRNSADNLSKKRNRREEFKIQNSKVKIQKYGKTFKFFKTESIGPAYQKGDRRRHRVQFKIQK
ncbi:hypothetical protein [Sphingobacterium hungaricum]|uniref:Uncharacterized protein n=1 Tax=Sphingobacterium hungaricum TaxID=2082723 RepID=A0A928UW97_9SPHI|nr:hypothetical protein [Sphingobacterium hungaricum]MBE8714400.1 hypothetical protein [Sphingobacterium hungaricum]